MLPYDPHGGLPNRDQPELTSHLEGGNPLGPPEEPHPLLDQVLRKTESLLEDEHAYQLIKDYLSQWPTAASLDQEKLRGLIAAILQPALPQPGPPDAPLIAWVADTLWDDPQAKTLLEQIWTDAHPG
jgi:hypothetical protein